MIGTLAIILAFQLLLQAVVLDVQNEPGRGRGLIASPTRCAICGGAPLAGPRRLPGLDLWRCRACGHRVASHAEAAATPADDYHHQYDEGVFLQALQSTRTRQAQRILGLLRRHLPVLTHVADFGAGRGFFLHGCKGAGVVPLAGLDTSPLAVEGLAANGIEAHLLSEQDAPFDALRRLSFSPRVVSFLDVIEHFPPGELQARVRGAMAAAGDGLELLVIKVPIPGLLYGGASLLCALGVPGPMAAALPAGTWPPHFSYFSKSSLRRLLDDCGLTVVEAVATPTSRRPASPIGWERAGPSRAG
jgi:hypothetical protein